ncbi:MAG: HlyD family efflux transporter periplasmic adaptor subunit [Legionellales bacterium]|nr:HlyD family efflux transporter periplasmic adaptor subunit [Legionellales bacterium]
MEENVDLKESARLARRIHLIKIACIALLGFALLFTFYWLGWGRFYDSTNDAYVTGNLIPLMSQTSGTVIAINTDNTDLVEEGQPIVELEQSDAKVALEQATARLAQTVREVRQYYEDVPKGKAEVALRKANLELAERNLQRRLGLVGAMAISREELQDNQNAVAVAKAQYDLAKHQLITAIALVQHSHLYTHPLVEETKANFKNAYLAYVRTHIYAPARGYTAKRNIQVGQQITPSTNLLSIVPLDEIWADANFKETQLERIRIGQNVKLTADANDFTYHGKVQGLEAGTGAAFALLPPQNATGNWIKIVQRLPVRIQLDPKEIAAHPLQIGLSMNVTIYTRGEKGQVLATAPQEKPIYITTNYADQLSHVNELIDAIIHQNAPVDVGYDS